MLNPFPVILADLRRSRAGCLAIIGLIAVATALGVAISAQERALRRGSAAAAEAFDLLIGARGSPTQLVMTAVYLQPAALELVPGHVLQQLQADPGVVYVAPLALGDAYERYPIVGTTADFLTQGGNVALASGRVFTHLHEAVVGADVPLVAEQTFLPMHGQPGEGNLQAPDVHRAFSYTVVGRLPHLGTPWDRAILVPVEAVWTLHGLSDGHAVADARERRDSAIGPPWESRDIPGAPALVVKPRSVRDAYRLRNLYRMHHATMAVFPAEVLVELYALLGDVRSLFTVISVGTQGLVIAAILLAVFAALLSRRRQLAVLRALGASRGYIFAVVWCSVSGLICVGALCGLLLGWMGAWGVSLLVGSHTGIALPVAMTWQEIRLVLALMGLGMGLALVPAWSSYRQSVSTVLQS